jgi:hypothetical protein
MASYPLLLSCPHLIKLLSLTDCFICRSLMQLRDDVFGQLSGNQNQEMHMPKRAVVIVDGREKLNFPDQI